MHFNKQHNEFVENEKSDRNILNSTTTTATATSTPTAIPTSTSLSIEADAKRKIRNISETEKGTFLGTTTTATSCTSSTDSGVNISDNETTPSPSPYPQTPPSSFTSITTVNPFNHQHYHNNNKNTNEDNNNINKFNDDDDSNNNRQTQLNNSTNFDKKFKSEVPQNRDQQPQLTQQLIKVENSSNEHNYTPPYQSDNQNAIKSKNVINISQYPDTTATTTTKNLDTASLQHYGFIGPPTQRSTSPSLSISSTNSSFKHPRAAMRHNGSPVVSIRSIDSSVIDSDSDSDLNGDIEGVHENYVIKKLGTQVSYPPRHPEIPSINKGLTVLNQHVTPHGGRAPPSPIAALTAIGDNLGVAQALGPVPANSAIAQRPQIGSIALSNSSDVTFGDKHFYEGPVTIQQFLIDGRDKWKQNNGKENPTFENDNTDAPNYAKDINPSSAQSSKLYGYIAKHKKFIIPGVLTVMTLLVVATILGSEALNDSKTQDNVGGGNVLRIVPRDGWLAQPPINPWVPLDLPVERVIIIPTKTDQCETQAACTYRVRITQTFNIESQQQDDIIYNFLIGGDGNVYEGRGWHNRGSALKGFNDGTISLAYIGSFKTQTPSDKQLNVTRLLLEEGVRLGKLSTDYRIVGSNKLDPTSTATSADALYKSFENWPHWSDN